MQIAIVGLGVAGNGTLKALIDFKNQHPKQSLTIDIYDESTSLGNGFPYQEDDHKLVMNSYAKDLSIEADNPNDLLDWLSYHHKEYCNPGAFIPRAMYGDYLKDRMKHYLD
uniref:FAD/NAD(P)-binding protein n=1 Tax=Aerococcus urinaeequi TaxID=51665 RepID=UPI00352B3B5E